MKISNFLPLILLSLTACQDFTEVTPTLNPFELTKFERKKELYEGDSGLVQFQIVQLHDEPIKLPYQIKVTIEKPSSDFKNLSVTEYPNILINLLFAKNNDVVSFGCNPEDPTTLPMNINAGKVILCGKVKIPLGSFEMRASTLEFRDTEISVESSASQYESLNSPPVVMIHTARFIVTGSNLFTLEGYSHGEEREYTPALFMDIGETLGEGDVHIISRKTLNLL